MLTFATPSLLPLLALLVPLAIYLWNRRPGQEIAVGSLRWLAATATHRLRRLRPAQLPLLLLRLLLLAGLGLALAGPRWQTRRPAGGGQVLVAPALAGSPALAAERPRLDSLRRQGYRLRWLAPQLPPISAAAWQADSLGRPPGSILPLDHVRNAPDFYAARLQLAADSLPSQQLYALIPATLRGNLGTRQVLPAGVHWRALPLPAATTWLQAATATADSLHLRLGQGSENQVVFTTRRVARPRAGAQLAVPGLPPLRYQPGSPAAHLVAAGPDAAPVAVRPAALRVCVYAPAARAAEARTLRAALRAAALGLPGPLALTLTTTAPDPAQAPDWLFWLAEAPAPAAWRQPVQRGLHLWQFAPGAGRADTAYLAVAGLAGPIALWRRAAGPAAPQAAPRWLDGLGRPVLTAAPLGQGCYYQLATRLSPAWSDLAASPDLPALLLDVLHPAFDLAGRQQLAAHDPRRLDPAQLLPTRRPATRRPAPPFNPPTDLQAWLVLAVAVLFGLERWLASRRRLTPFAA